jgi:hypothetical protein
MVSQKKLRSAPSTGPAQDQTSRKLISGAFAPAIPIPIVLVLIAMVVARGPIRKGPHQSPHRSPYRSFPKT